MAERGDDSSKSSVRQTENLTNVTRNSTTPPPELEESKELYYTDDEGRLYRRPGPTRQCSRIEKAIPKGLNAAGDRASPSECMVEENKKLDVKTGSSKVMVQGEV